MTTLAVGVEPAHSVESVIARLERLINHVFVVFGIVLAIGGTVCVLFAIETKGRVLEELSP